MPIKLFTQQSARYPICVAYVATQFVVAFATFHGTLLEFSDSLVGPENTKTNRPKSLVLLGTVLLSLCAAITIAFTAYKFQGSKIVNPPKELPDPFTAKQSPNSRFGRGVQWLYLVSAQLVLMTNNYFLLSAIEGWGGELFLSPADPSLLSLTQTSMVIWFIKTFCVDLFFSLTNENFASLQELNKDFTGTTQGHIGEGIFNDIVKKPFLLKPMLWNVMSIGVVSHVLTEFVDLLMYIRPSLIRWVYSISPLLLIPPALLVAAVVLPLMLITAMQTYYFEAKTSEVNLKNLEKRFTHPKRSLTLFEEPPEEPLGWMGRFIGCCPGVIPILKASFHTQGLMHGLVDTAPLLVYLFDLFSRYDVSGAWWAWPVMITAAVLTVIGSGLGAYHSEVKGAIEAFEETTSRIPRLAFS